MPNGLRKIGHGQFIGRTWTMGKKWNGKTLSGKRGRRDEGTMQRKIIG